MSDYSATDPFNLNYKILLASVLGMILFFLLVDISKKTHCSDRNIFVREHANALQKH